MSFKEADRAKVRVAYLFLGMSGALLHSVISI